MTYQLTATIMGKGWDEPIVHRFTYEGETKDDILTQIDTLPYHRNNLKLYGRTRFKDTSGNKHEWVFKPLYLQE